MDRIYTFAAESLNANCETII